MGPIQNVRDPAVLRGAWIATPRRVTIFGAIATTVLTHAATSSAGSGSTLTQPLFSLILTILARRRLAAKLRAEISKRKLDERAAGVRVGR